MILLALLLALYTPKPTEGVHERYYNYGQQAQKAGEYQKAITYYKSAVQAKKEYPAAYANMGICYTKLADQNLTSAMTSLQKALTSNPDMGEALAAQGETYLMQGDIDEAYKIYQRLLKVDAGKATVLKTNIDTYLLKAKSVLSLSQHS